MLFHQMTLEQLKAEAHLRGLSNKGSVTDLITRLTLSERIFEDATSEATKRMLRANNPHLFPTDEQPPRSSRWIVNISKTIIFASIQNYVFTRFMPRLLTDVLEKLNRPVDEPEEWDGPATDTDMRRARNYDRAVMHVTNARQVYVRLAECRQYFTYTIHVGRMIWGTVKRKNTN